MTRYTVKATGNSNWRDKSVCEIGISLGHQSHKGAKLIGLLDWADRNFDQCIITLSDTLYRYNLIAQGLSEAQAYMTSRRMGDQWLADNRALVSPFSNKKFMIQRWDEWLNHTAFEKTHQDVINFYHQDINFSVALEQDIESFVNRNMASEEQKAIKRAEQSSRKFLLEETAAYILIARTHQALRVYPAKDMHCFEHMRKTEIIPEHLQGLELAPHLDVNFKRKGQNNEEAA